MIWDMKFCLDIIMIISTVKKIFQYSEENKRNRQTSAPVFSVLYYMHVDMWFECILIISLNIMFNVFSFSQVPT